MKLEKQTSDGSRLAIPLQALFSRGRPVATVSLVLVTVVSLLVFISGCLAADPWEKLLGDSQLQGWEVYSRSYMQVLHAPDGPPEARLESQCNKLIYGLGMITGKLGMNPYPDSVRMVYYLDETSATNLTSRDLPFVDDGIIHFWEPHHPGPLLADLVLAIWSPDGTEHPCLRSGVRRMFGRAKRQPLLFIQESLADGGVTPLGELTSRESFAANEDDHFTREAASFVAYILEVYGTDKLHRLYGARGSFSDAAQDVLSLSMADLERGWHSFTRLRSAPVPLN